MNKWILLVIVLVFTAITYFIFRYLVGWEDKKALIVTGVAFLAMVVPEIIQMAKGRDRETG